MLVYIVRWTARSARVRRPRSGRAMAMARRARVCSCHVEAFGSLPVRTPVGRTSRQGLGVEGGALLAAG